MATYEGVLAGLLDALDRIAELGRGGGEAPMDGPLVLIGGGAEGPVWRDTVRRLSGRAVRLPAEPELVALGAAVQAATLLSDEDGPVIARRWAGSATEGDRLLPALPQDLELLARIRDVRTRATEEAAAGGPA